MHTFSIRSLFFTLTVLAVALATPLRAAVATAQLTTPQATLTYDARGLSLAPADKSSPDCARPRPMRQTLR